MKDLFEAKAEKLFNEVTTDLRWDINDEKLFNVFGLTYYGYCFGFGKLICFLDPEDINSFVAAKLVGLGAGQKYVNGLIDYAYATFQQPTEGLYAELVGLGHAQFSSDDTTSLTETIFTQAKA